MPQHLSKELAEGYRRRALSKPELITADQHLASCPECREMLANREGLNSQIDSLLADLDKSLEEDHVDYSQLEAYVDWKLSADERQALDLHFRSCALCSEELQDLQVFKEQLGRRGASASRDAANRAGLVQRRPRRALSVGFPVSWRAGSRWALAACALLALAVGIRLVWESQRKATTVVHKPAATPPPTAEATTAAARGGLLPGQTLGDSLPLPQHSTTNLVTLPSKQPSFRLAAELQSVVASVVASQHLQVPRGFANLGVRRGPNDGPWPLLSPVGTVVSGTKPVFQWRSVPDAQGYKVQISDSQQNVVGASPVLTHTSWKSTVVLQRGTSYVWRVVIIAKGVELEESPLDVPQGRFQVLSASDFQQIQEFKRHANFPVHFYLGILLAHAGALEEAAEEFRAVPPSDPNYELAKRFEREAKDLIVRQRA